MQPTVKGINVRRGDTKEMFFRVRTKVWNATTLVYEAGPYKDLTGYTITSQIRQTKASDTVLLTFTVTLGNQADVTNGRGGVYMVVSADDTATVPLTISTGFYDIQFQQADGTVFTYIEGAVGFDEDVTRA